MNDTIAGQGECPCCGAPCDVTKTPAWDHRWTDENGQPQRTHHHAIERYAYRSGHLVQMRVERSVAIDLVAHLAAAISLLEKGGKAAKKGAPSDKMFDQMIRDYKASLHRGREAIAAAEPFGGDGA